jgi:predicted 3-demethylubiquinone-9 3-methyltransferase (glyoxalase superfamily)
MSKITPFLWFDTQAEEAADLYTSIFPNSRVASVARYGDSGPGPTGSTMTVSFELDGQEFVALNGGPQHYTFNESVSFVVDCESQEEVDHFWSKLTADGGSESRCGWLKDRCGLSWQIVPRRLRELLGDPDPARAGRAMEAMLKMATSPPSRRPRTGRDGSPTRCGSPRIPTPIATAPLSGR